MKQLDLVYNTFTNLEKNYARSKKTRSEYINDKFGGDISTAMFLILNALSVEEFTDPEDIRKFSVIRDIFDKIKQNEARLDSLKSFNFEEDTSVSRVSEALSAGQRSGTGISVEAQEELYQSGALHYRVGANAVAVTPLRILPGVREFPRYVRLFNPGMAALFSGLCPELKAPNGSLLERKQVGLVYVKAEKVEF